MRPCAVVGAGDDRFADQQQVAVAVKFCTFTDEIVAAVDDSAVQWRQQLRAFDS